MRFKLEIKMDNAAFEDEPDELSRILRNVADRVSGLSVRAGATGGVHDINGNNVGSWSIK